MGFSNQDVADGGGISASERLIEAKGIDPRNDFQMAANPNQPAVAPQLGQEAGMGPVQVASAIDTLLGQKKPYYVPSTPGSPTPTGGIRG